MTITRENCPLRHENGNCLSFGGFCLAGNNDICHALHNAYEKGVTAYLKELLCKSEDKKQKTELSQMLTTENVEYAINVLSLCSISEHCFRASAAAKSSEVAACVTTIRALRAAQLVANHGGLGRLLELAKADDAGLLLRLPCPDGTPYYKIERDCSRCTAYDGSGLGDTYCTLSKDYLNHEFDGAIVPGCPIPFVVKEYDFHAGTFERNHWDKDFGKTIFLDPAEAQKVAEELNRKQAELNIPHTT